MQTYFDKLNVDLRVKILEFVGGPSNIKDAYPGLFETSLKLLYHKKKIEKKRRAKEIYYQNFAIRRAEELFQSLHLHRIKEGEITKLVYNYFGRVLAPRWNIDLRQLISKLRMYAHTNWGDNHFIRRLKELFREHHGIEVSQFGFAKRYFLLYVVL